MPEQPQSLESQLKMAKPKRAEIKRVPLTDEEKEFLGNIMDKAVAAEKAGKLQEALDLYTDYKNELLKIKEEKDKKIKEDEKKIWTLGRLEEWVEKVYEFPDFSISEYTAQTFDLTKFPRLETIGYLRLRGKVIDEFPPNLTVNGHLLLNDAEVKKWNGPGLTVKGSCDMKNAKLSHIPENTHVTGSFDIARSAIENLPDNIYVGHNFWVGGCSDKVKEKAQKLAKEGKIKGKVIIPS